MACAPESIAIVLFAVWVWPSKDEKILRRLLASLLPSRPSSLKGVTSEARAAGKRAGSCFSSGVGGGDGKGVCGL